MKNRSVKIIRLARCFMLLFTALMLAVGCAENRGGGEKLATPEAVCARALELGSFPEMKKGDEATVSDFFGIELEKIKSYELRMSSVGTLADEIAVFELADEGYRSTLVNLLKQRLVRAASVARDYSPEQHEILQKSSVEEKGAFVFYIVNAKSESIVSELKKAM